ncbi:MAG: hypothetical protein SGI77_17275 [Pirellulaceae bacterium]|nr:hypothetical protein [Pirellulaceae bacterium]
MQTSNCVHAAIYARVSSDAQAQEQTIDSQVAAIRLQVATDRVELDPRLSRARDRVANLKQQLESLESESREQATLRDALHATRDLRFAI